MLELQAGGGLRGAAKQFYYRHRVLVVSVVLSIAGLVTGTTTALAILQKFAFINGALLAVGFVLAAVVSLFQLRHVPLALVSAFAPIPGLLWAAPISGVSEFGAAPLLAYGFGYAFAALVAERRVELVLGESRQENPWRAALVSVGLMGVFAFFWCRGSASSDAALQAVADTGLSVCSAALLLPLAMTWLHFDEGFVAQANRARERRARILEWAAKATIPRWAFSFTGITIIFLALGWYGAEPAIREGALLPGATVLLVVVTAGIVCGGWRQGLAIGLVTSTACLIALWATVVDSRAPFAAVGVLQITTLAIFLALCSGRQALALRHQNEPPVIAERRALERSSSRLFAGLGVVAALLPACAVWKGSLAFVIGAVTAVIAATVLVPAVATAFEVLMPRRRSVEEIYGRRKKPLVR